MSDKFKEGLSIQELENFARKYTNEVFLIAGLVIASLSTMLDFFSGPSWSLACATLGFILCVAFPETLVKVLRKLFSFYYKEDKTMQYVIGGIRIALAIFVPFILFAEIGLLAGNAFHYLPRHLGQSPEEKK